MDIPSSSTAGPLPDFVIIGAMKAGSTSLYEYLARHPQIFLSPEKEPMYFSRNHKYHRGEQWYRSLFASAQPGQFCGEASTCYSRAPHYEDVPARMVQLIPQARLIYILRHPVERAYSHYRWDMQQLHRQGSYEPVTFEQALERTEEFVDASSYIRQIDRYLEYFPREQILVMTLDELKTDGEAALRSCQDFLGLEIHNLVGEGLIVANAADERRVSSYRVREKVGRFREFPVLRQLVNLMPTEFRRRAKVRLVAALDNTVLAKRMRRQHAAAISPLRAETRKALLARLAGPTRELEEFLGRPVPVSWFE